jgi:zinc D-Ala-D-Ala dipeptidase
MVEQETIQSISTTAPSTADATPAELAHFPVPLMKDAPTAADYHQLPITKPQSDEDLVEITKFGIACDSFYFRKDGLNAPYYRQIEGSLETAWCRESVARKLQKVNQTLNECALELLVLDAYRPTNCQESLWSFFIEQARNILGPQATESEQSRFASQFCSNPTSFDPADPQTWATHVTGGAVDLTLRRLGTGEPLYMGSIFDDPSELSNTDYFERQDLSNLSSFEARKNRRILYWAMSLQEFANYPYEWWHFDFGNQMWVQNSPSSVGRIAWYGAVEPPAFLPLSG